MAPAGRRVVGPGRLVVFDCDGVLVDSERLNIELDVAAIRELGWPITREEVIERHLGRSEADALADIAAVIGRPVPAEWLQRWRTAYQAAYDTQLVAVPGIAAAIPDILAAGWRICVATSGRREITWAKLARCALAEFFTEESLFTAAEVPHGKPAPDLFLHAASRLGYDPGACVVVEDSHHGIAAARAAGMRCIGYAGGITPRAHLAGADLILDDLGGLTDALSALA